MMIGNERLEDESERILDVNRANLVAEMDQGWKEYYRHLRSFFFDEFHRRRSGNYPARIGW